MTDKTDTLLALAAEIRASLGNGATPSTRRRWAIEIEALAEQPAPPAASVDVDSIMEVVKKYTSNHSVLNPLIRCDLTKLIDSAGGEAR